MPKSNITTASVRQAAKPKQQRKAPDHLIQAWARSLCASGDDPAGRMSALLLLLDEIERSCSDYDRVEEVAWLARSSVFGKSAAADKAMREIVANLRAQKGLHLVHSS